MALNPFFLQGSSSEQFLVQDLINEQLKMYGIEVYYLPRKYIKTDNILNEVETSKFDDSFLIEAYLDNYEGYAPGSDLMSKFGLRLKNEINLIISRERYEEFITPFLNTSSISNNSEYDIQITSRPREGDLIYFPLGQRLFEIKRVEHEKPFYQLGKNYVYELQCELFEYENEDIDTSIETIDKTVEDEGYITTLNLAKTAINATATASIDNGVVSRLILNDDGSSYTSTPVVAISTSPSGNSVDNATAVAITTSVGNVQSIKELRITFGGRGYSLTSPPTVTITGGGGSGAEATAVVSNGAVNTITLGNPGDEYTSSPIVTIPNPAAPGAGTTATAIANVGSGGVLSSIQISNAGFGYTTPPSVQISVASTVSIGGTFIYNETVTGSRSGTTAQVRGFEVSNEVNPTRTLRVALNTGKFFTGETIVGSASSATYILTSYDDNSHDDPFDRNEEFEIAADSLLDFTETNPFGEV